MRTERVLTAILLGALATGAQALQLQFKPSAHVELQRDSNIFRAPDVFVVGNAPRVGDTLTTYGAGARLSLQESLQALEVQGEVDRVDYATLSDLSHDRYRWQATARLAYASRLKLRLDAGQERHLENFAYRVDTQKGFTTVERETAELTYAMTPEWVARAQADRYTTQATLLASRSYDLRESAGEAGVDYLRNGFSRVGLALRQVDGQYPQRVVTPGDGVEKDYTQRSLLLRAGYTPSGLSDFAGQIAYTDRTHRDPAVRNFSGVTGRVSYLRRLSGLTQIQLEAYRDLYYIEDANANYVENLGARLAIDYRYSPILALALATERYESSYKGTPAFNIGGASRRDEVFNIRLGADYRPFYRMSVLPEYRYEQRRTNQFNRDYRFDVIGVDFTYSYDTGGAR